MPFSTWSGSLWMSCCAVPVVVRLIANCKCAMCDRHCHVTGMWQSWEIVMWWSYLCMQRTRVQSLFWSNAWVGRLAGKENSVSNFALKCTRSLVSALRIFHSSFIKQFRLIYFFTNDSRRYKKTCDILHDFTMNIIKKRRIGLKESKVCDQIKTYMTVNFNYVSITATLYPLAIRNWDWLTRWRRILKVIIFHFENNSCSYRTYSEWK